MKSYGKSPYSAGDRLWITWNGQKLLVTFNLSTDFMASYEQNMHRFLADETVLPAIDCEIDT